MGIGYSHLLHLFGGQGVVASSSSAVVAPPARPDGAAGSGVLAPVLLVAGLVDGLVVVGKLLRTVPTAAVQLTAVYSM